MHPVEKNLIDQAGWCRRLGSPFTAELLERCTQNFGEGGIVHHLMADWTGAAHMDAAGLRLIGALHHAVLSGADEELAAAYPNAAGEWDSDAAWEAAQSWLKRNVDAVQTFLESPPQTNETRRSMMLLTGVLHLARRFDMPLHMLELGASAGLNVMWDKYRYATQTWRWGGASDVVIETGWAGPPPPLDVAPVIASRAACDQNPLDLSDPEARLRLKSYIWADQADRLARFDAAASLSLAEGVAVDEADAAVWLEAKLNERPETGATIIYHTVFFQYPPRETRRKLQDLIEKAGAQASAEAPIAWLRFEPEALFGGGKGSMGMNLDVRTWPGDDHHLFARSDGHVTRVDYKGGEAG